MSKWQSVCPAEAKPIVVVSEIFIKNQFFSEAISVYFCNLILFFTFRHLLHLVVLMQAPYPDHFLIYSDDILYSARYV